MTPSNSSRVLFSPEEGRTRGKEPVNVQETNSKKKKKRKKKKQKKKASEHPCGVHVCSCDPSRLCKKSKGPMTVSSSVVVLRPILQMGT